MVEYCEVCIHVVEVVGIRRVFIVRPLPGYERGTIKSVTYDLKHFDFAIQRPCNRDEQNSNKGVTNLLGNS